MSKNVFGELDLDTVKDQADAMSDGKYAGFVFDSQIVTKKDQRRAWVLTYKPDRNIHPHFDSEVSQTEWFDIDYAPTLTAGDIETKKRWLKRRILSLGVKEDEVSTFNLADVIGLPVAFTIKTNGQYKNIVTVELRDESSTNGFSNGNGYTQSDASEVGLKDLM